MKLVHTARHPTEAHLIKGMLEAEGVRASVLGDQLYGAYGELPVLPTVWVLDDTLALHADGLIVDFLRGGPARRYGHRAGPVLNARKCSKDSLRIAGNAARRGRHAVKRSVRKYRRAHTAAATRSWSLIPSRMQRPVQGR